jgi:DNA-binding CsgD family transcriptional regulator
MRSETIAAAKAFMELFPKRTEGEQREVFKAEDDRETILQQLRFAESVFPGSALSMCGISHPGITYFSQNSEHILGHSHEWLLSMPISQFFSLAHPEDVPHIKQCYDFIKTLEPYDPEEYRFSIYFRLSNAAGEYMHIRIENLALRTGNDKYLYLMLYNNVSEEKFYHVKLDISRRSKGVFSKVSSYNPRQANLLMTPRQRDIMELIAKGYTNHEIAERLNVSVYTVKNHKQMLFKKMNVKSSMELARYVRKELQVMG